MRVTNGYATWLKPPQRHVQPLAGVLVAKAPKEVKTASFYRSESSPDRISTLIGVA